MLGGQEALLEQALQHRAHGWPVHQLQHEQVRLRREEPVRAAAREPSLLWSSPCHGLALPIRGAHQPATARENTGIWEPLACSSPVTRRTRLGRARLSLFAPVSPSEASGMGSWQASWAS